MQHTHSTLRHILEMLMHTCTLLPPLDKLILSPVRSLAALAGKRLLNDRYGYNVTAGTGNLQREYIGARVCRHMKKGYSRHAAYGAWIFQHLVQ